MFDKRNRAWQKQFIAFFIIGILNTAIDMGLFTLLVVMNIHYAVAQLAAYLAGMTNSYLMNSAITFRSEGKAARGADGWRQRFRFLVWNGAMLALSILLIGIAAELFGFMPLVAKAAVTAVIVFLNFYGSKKWVFANNRAVEAGGAQ